MHMLSTTCAHCSGELPGGCYQSGTDPARGGYADHECDCPADSFTGPVAATDPTARVASDTDPAVRVSVNMPADGDASVPSTPGKYTGSVNGGATFGLNISEAFVGELRSNTCPDKAMGTCHAT